MTGEHAPRYLGVLIAGALGNLLYLANYDPCGSNSLHGTVFIYLLAPALASAYAWPRVSWRLYWTNGALVALAMATTAAIYSLPLAKELPCESILGVDWPTWFVLWGGFGVVTVAAGAVLAGGALLIVRIIRRL